MKSENHCRTKHSAACGFIFDHILFRQRSGNLRKYDRPYPIGLSFMIAAKIHICTTPDMLVLAITSGGGLWDLALYDSFPADFLVVGAREVADSARTL